MQCAIHEQGESKVAVPEKIDPPLTSAQDALDLLGSLSYLYGCHKLVLHREQLAPEFFQLRTGLAGDILQKFSNYGVKLAIVGDFSQEQSKPLRDFIYECNQGKQVFFLATQAEALDRLHRV